MDRSRLYPSALALLAAFLFGASAPLAKLLLGQIEPVPLAAFLYLGAGVVLLALRIPGWARRRSQQREARLRREDLGWLAGSVLAGGIVAPIVLLFSLRVTAAATASLLLNFETVATTLIAVLAFKEAVGGRAWLAIGLITLASILLTINPEAGWGFSLGALGIIAACLLWGLDNNFTRNISAKDPLIITTIKGLAAGTFSLGLALALGNQLPKPAIALGAMVLGSLSYGLSIALFIRAMRGLGAARTSALFGTAPLAGVFLSLFIFHEMPSLLFVAALPIMVIGTFVLIREQHAHSHVHVEITHEHAHVHDDGHHEHEHQGAISGAHSHPHMHAELNHEHEHTPDLHHRHSH